MTEKFSCHGYIKVNTYNAAIADTIARFEHQGPQVNAFVCRESGLTAIQRATSKTSPTVVTNLPEETVEINIPFSDYPLGFREGVEEFLAELGSHAKEPGRFWGIYDDESWSMHFGPDANAVVAETKDYAVYEAARVLSAAGFEKHSILSALKSFKGPDEQQSVSPSALTAVCNYLNDDLDLHAVVKASTGSQYRIDPGKLLTALEAGGLHHLSEHQQLVEAAEEVLDEFWQDEIADYKTSELAANDVDDKQLQEHAAKGVSHPFCSLVRLNESLQQFRGPERTQECAASEETEDMGPSSS